MALFIGDVSREPAAQSFISLADADEYLAPEMRLAWVEAAPEVKEAALVAASRWLAATYRFVPLDSAKLPLVGRVAARLAAETLGLSIFAGTDTAAMVKSEKVGSLAVTYETALQAHAAGMAWGWLDSMLHGLIYQRGLGIGAMVV